MADELKLIWTRPTSVEYPKVYRTFKARDLDSNELIEYRIQDLPESRFEDAIKQMVENYLPDEPISQVLGKRSFRKSEIKEIYLYLRSIA